MSHKNVYLKFTFALILFLQDTLVRAQTTVIDSFLHKGIYRSYRIYIPAINDGIKKVPLVFNLHGLRSNAMEQELYGDFRAIADTANFIIVSANGSNVIFTINGWNTFNTIGTGADDLGFISQLLDTVNVKYPINKNKVYATGMSNGGFMSYELACFLSHRVAAIASVTGSMTEERRIKCDAKHATPIMQIHGTADNTVGYDGTNFLSGSPSFTHIDSLMQYWVKFNSCGTSAIKTTLPNISTTDGCTAEHYVWSGGKESSSVELYKIIDGEHTWPGAAVSTGTTNQDFNASAEIWRFFNQYSLDQFSTLTSIKDKEELTEDALIIFPNPAKESINIQFPNTIHKEMRIEILDQMGKQWYASNTSKSLINIPCGHYPSGMYFVSVGNGETKKHYKVIIN